MDWIKILNTVIIAVNVLGNMNSHSYIQNNRSLENNRVSKNNKIHTDNSNYRLQTMKPSYTINSNKRITRNGVSSYRKSLKEKRIFSNSSIKYIIRKTFKTRNHLFDFNRENNYYFMLNYGAQQSLAPQKHKLGYNILNRPVFKVDNASVNMCSENNKTYRHIMKNVRLKFNSSTMVSPDFKTLNKNNHEKLKPGSSVHQISKRELNTPASYELSKNNSEGIGFTSTYFPSNDGTFKLISNVKQKNSFLKFSGHSFLQNKNASGQKIRSFINETNELTTESISLSDIVQNLASEISRLNKTLSLILTQTLEKSRIRNDTQNSEKETFLTKTTSQNNVNNSTQYFNDFVQNSTSSSATLFHRFTEDKNLNNFFVTSTMQPIIKNNIDSVLRTMDQYDTSPNRNVQETIKNHPVTNRIYLTMESTVVTKPTVYPSLVNQPVRQNLTSFNNIQVNASKNNHNNNSNFLKNYNKDSSSTTISVQDSNTLEDTYSNFVPQEKMEIGNNSIFTVTRITSNSPIGTSESYGTEISYQIQRSKDTTEAEQTSTPTSGLNFTLENVTLTHVINNFKKTYPVGLWESGGYFTEHFLLSINPHWLQFPPPPPVYHYLLAALCCIIMIAGIVGNSLVIVMFVRCRSLRTPANILVMNLAVSDLLLMSMLPVFVYNSIYRGPVFGEIGCQIYGFVGGLTGTVSIMTLAAISLDRYYVIVYPLDPLRKTTRCRARLSIVFAWCYGSIFSLLPLLPIGLGRYVPEGYLTSCSFDYLEFSFSNRVFIFIFFLAAWFIPFCVITICYAAICRVVIVTRNGKHMVGVESARHEKNRSELRLAGVVIGIIGLWFAAWTPYAVVALLGIAGKKEYITPLSSMIPALFCKTASCIDPYVYAVTHPKFRLEVNSLVRRISSKSKFRIKRNKSSMIWTTQYEMSETSRHQVSQKRRQNSDDCSDVEEMIVIIDSKLEKKKSVSSSDENTLSVGTVDEDVFKENDPTSLSHRQAFPVSKAESVKFQPPTWFVPPKPLRDKSTSFRRKFKPRE